MGCMKLSKKATKKTKKHVKKNDKPSVKVQDIKVPVKEEKSFNIGIIAIIFVLIIAIAVSAVFISKDMIKENAINTIKLDIQNNDGQLEITTEKTYDEIVIEQKSVDYLIKLFIQNQIPINEQEIKEEIAIREILYYNALQKNIDISEFENILGQEQFKQRIQATGENPEEFISKYKEEMKKDYYIQNYFNNYIMELVPKQKARATSHILICYEGTQSCDSNRTKEEAYTIIENIQQKAIINNSFESFATLAQEYSEGPSSVQGGYLGPVSKGQMVPAFEEENFAIDLNEISDIVETPFGFHIIRVSEIQEVPNTQKAMEYIQKIKEEILANVELEKINIKVE